MKIPPWSFSSLSKYETCGHMYYLTRVAKKVFEPPTEATMWGNKVHKALELRVKDKAVLPEGMTQWEPLVSKFDTARGQVLVEHRYCLSKNLQTTLWSSPDAWTRGIIDVAVDAGKKAFLGDWKGFPIHTEIPTPRGFVEMGDLQVGSLVFSGDGVSCRVVGKSAINYRQCYKVSFDDRTSITCDDQHLWALHDSRVVSVIHLRPKDKILLAGAVQYPSKVLPIDPYVLGLWLADGKHTSSEISKPDLFVWEEIQRRGYVVDMATGGNKSCPTRTVRGIRRKLSQLGVLGNKHIPTEYMQGSIQQRLDLVRGMMDGDGSVNAVRQQAVFTNTDRRLSVQLKEVLESLGQRVNLATTTQHGFGLTVQAYPLAFKPQGINPFLLPRKADRVLPSWGRGKAWYRRVVSVEPTTIQETQCISVNSEDNTYLVGRNYLRTHNTGKEKDDPDQLRLSAAAFMQERPYIEQVKTGFIWLASGRITPNTYTREDVPAIWQDFIHRSQRLENAYETDKWVKKPSGLCAGWCPAGKDNCEFWSPKKERR